MSHRARPVTPREGLGRARCTKRNALNSLNVGHFPNGVSHTALWTLQEPAHAAGEAPNFPRGRANQGTTR